MRSTRNAGIRIGISRCSSRSHELRWAHGILHFLQIASGEAPCHKIWEDEKHLAFLSIFPNTEGFSVVITKEHYPSYAFDVPEKILTGLTLAAKSVGKLLDAAFNDVGRTGMIFEGFGIDHLHAKLFPMHGTKMKEWKPLKSNVDKYFEKYEGYISSHDFQRADDEKLAALAAKIRSYAADASKS